MNSDVIKKSDGSTVAAASEKEPQPLVSLGSAKNSLGKAELRYTADGLLRRNNAPPAFATAAASKSMVSVVPFSDPPASGLRDSVENAVHTSCIRSSTRKKKTSSMIIQ